MINFEQRPREGVKLKEYFFNKLPSINIYTDIDLQSQTQKYEGGECTLPYKEIT